MKKHLGIPTRSSTWQSIRADSVKTGGAEGRLGAIRHAPDPRRTQLLLPKLQCCLYTRMSSARREKRNRQRATDSAMNAERGASPHPHFAEMSTTLQSSISLTSAPKGYKAPAFQPLSGESGLQRLLSLPTKKLTASLLVPPAAPSTSAHLLPAGPAFLSHARRVLNQRSFAEDDRLLAEEHAKNGGAVVEEDDADAGLGDEQEEKSLLQLDPKLWKVRLQTSALTSCRPALTLLAEPANRSKITTPFSDCRNFVTRLPRSRSRRLVSRVSL